MNARSPNRPNHPEEIVEAPPLWARFGGVLALLEFVGACALCGMVIARYAADDCSGYACAILYAVVVFPGSILGALLLLAVRNLLLREMRTRLMVDTVAVLLALVWWNVGQRVEEHQARVEYQQGESVRAIERAAAGTEDHYGRNRFFDALRRVGNHGAPGQVPAVVRVHDDGTEVEVELLDALGEHYPVAVARVMPDPGSRKGWRGCPMVAAGAQRAHGAFLLRPREPVRFTLPLSCAGAFRDAPIEYRIGTWKIGSESPGWWSDSAIAVPEGWPEPAEHVGVGVAPASGPPPAIAEPGTTPPATPPQEAPVEIGPVPPNREERS
jgi:hypothetical protein